MSASSSNLSHSFKKGCTHKMKSGGRRKREKDARNVQVAATTEFTVTELTESPTHPVQNVGFTVSTANDRPLQESLSLDELVYVSDAADEPTEDTEHTMDQSATMSEEVSMLSEDSDADDPGGLLEETLELRESTDTIMEEFVLMSDTNSSENVSTNLEELFNSPKGSRNSYISFEQLAHKEFLVQMKPGAKLFFHGKLCVEVVSGRLCVMGWVMRPAEARPLFSPRSGSMLRLEAEDEACTLKLSPLESHLVASLHGLLPFKLYNGTRDTLQVKLPSSRAAIQAERALKCRFILDEKSTEPGITYFNHEMKNLLEILVHHSTSELNCRIVLCGGKGVGKSTTMRFLVNSILSKQATPAAAGGTGVLVLDLDPGQSEFTPAGCLSAVRVTSPLLGPGHTGRIAPDWTLFLGHIDVSRCVQSYRWSVKDLVRHCKQHFSNIPWIVNTMGFTSGLGVSLMQEVLRLLGPGTRVVELHSHRSGHNYPREVWHPSTPHSFTHHRVSSSVEAPMGSDSRRGQQNFHPRELREISLVAYLSPALCLPAFSLLPTKPWMIPLRVLVLGTIHEKVHPSNMVRALLGRLVALCHAGQNVRASCLQPHNQQGPLVLTQPLALPFFGYGVMVGVDVAAGQVYLQTPEPPARLRRVNCLLAGAVELPHILRIAGVEEGRPVPYTATGYGQPTSAPARRVYRPLSSLTPSKG